MVNLEHKITVDDLIVEYAMARLKNGYNPNFKSSDFIKFLDYFLKNSNIQIYDILLDDKKLFKRFYDRKMEHDWNDYPHLNIELKNKEYIIKPNYMFSDFDRSIINTYFIYDSRVDELREILNYYLSAVEKKRVLNENIKLNELEMEVSKYYAAKVFKKCWENHINDEIKCGLWPKQCTDIEKYLLNQDLAILIELKSIKKELIKFYKVLSKRMALLYNKDKNLQISMGSNKYLAYSNYNTLIGDNEILKDNFKKYKMNENYYDEDFSKSRNDLKIKKIVKAIDV